MKGFINLLFEVACVAIIAFIVACVFVDVWDKQEKIDASNQDARMHKMIERGF